MAGFNEHFDKAAQWTAATRATPRPSAAPSPMVCRVGHQRPACSRWSDTWQLVINTGTTIVTFLMVFLIQNTQNRDTAALQLKLDELIRASEGARNRLLQLEDLSEEEMEHIKRTFLHLARTGPRLGEEVRHW